jgi:hypothetical protein
MQPTPPCQSAGLANEGNTRAPACGSHKAVELCKFIGLGIETALEHVLVGNHVTVLQLVRGPTSACLGSALRDGILWNRLVYVYIAAFAPADQSSSIESF